MIRGLHHVALHTADIERLTRFYRDVVGFELIAESQFEWKDDATIDTIIRVPGSSAKTCLLRAGNIHLELFEYSSPPARGGAPLTPSDHGYTHICFDSDDVMADFARLRAGGMTFDREPVDIGFARTIYGKDPDGNVVELQQTLPDHFMALERLGERDPIAAAALHG